MVDSGCLPSPIWTVPAGVLHDVTYTWQATVSSGLARIVLAQSSCSIEGLNVLR